jgi:ribosomal protein S18 acetylase RimI-like enzyme
MQKHQIRNFDKEDSQAVNDLALASFEQYKDAYNNWPEFSKIISNMSSLSETAEIIVATQNEKLIGAVAYVPAGVTKKIFPTEWPVIRMLVVDPLHRGLGVGKALTEECIHRAHRDHASLIALHTSPIMTIALNMYLKMGFVFEKTTGNIFGMEYGIYVKKFF